MRKKLKIFCNVRSKRSETEKVRRETLDVRRKTCFSPLTSHFSLLTSHFSLLTSYFSLLTSHFLLLLLLTLFLISCSSTKTKPPWEYMPDMAYTVSVKAQEEPMRLPPAGTFPQGYTPYPYTKDQGDLAGAQLKNPLPITREVMLQGQKRFNTYCIVCHGERGKGDGSIIPKFPRPPTLQSDKVRNWSDGRIYHVITMGQNLMPSYATQISSDDCWAIIHYLRALQRADKPTAADIEEIKKALKEGKLP